MDIVISVLDDLFLDDVYKSLGDTLVQYGASASTLSYLARETATRQGLSLFALLWFSGYFIFLFFSTIEFLCFYDYEAAKKNPKFLDNQVWLEITCAVQAMPVVVMLTFPCMFLEVRGYSKVYHNVDDYGYLYLAASCVGYILFTDMLIYWIHRILHHPSIYKYCHKLHHKWIVPSPYASYAFHPVDSWLQSVPYHIYVLIVPLNAYAYLVLFVAVTLWTVMIHDGWHVNRDGILNSTAHHSIHHTDFVYNYGQYTTLWDRLGGSYREPTPDMFKEPKTAAPMPDGASKKKQ